jgi:hypothetical protein
MSGNHFGKVLNLQSTIEVKRYRQDEISDDVSIW